MNDNIFQRHEVKYLVSDWQRRMLEQAMRDRMVPDSHGESTVCNVYYDTPDFRLIRTSLEKPVYKEKLRIRSYGPAEERQPIFVEMKKKYKGIVYKRRISMEQRSAVAFLAGDIPLPEDSQIGHELEYFLRFYGELAPAVHLSYDRAAFFSREDPNLRVTFDRNILWRTTDLSLEAQPGGEPILESGQSLMEIKTAAAIPLWLVELLDNGGIRQTSFSKYGQAYCAMLQTHFEETGGVFCA